MSKVTLTNLSNLAGNPTTAQTSINNNNDVIEVAIDNTLSRDGTPPNQMGASLDMNSNRIINLAPPGAGTDAARYQDLTASFANITNVLAPAMAGNAGKFLETDGAALFWVDPTPVKAGQSGKVLGTDGVTLFWEDAGGALAPLHYDTTALETAALITPTNFSYPAGANWAYIGRYSGNLPQALLVASSNQYTIYIDSPIVLTVNATVPTTCTLIFIGSGSVSVNNTFTLTINGSVISSQSKTLTFLGAGTTTLTPTSRIFLTSLDIYEPLNSINAAQKAASYTIASFTGTLTGCTTSPTATINWSRTGNIIILELPDLSATSNTTACTITGVPANLTPVRTQVMPCKIVDNSIQQIGSASIAGTTITLATGNAASFTNVGTKGCKAGSLVYNLT